MIKNCKFYSQVHREEMVYEISDLLHRRLVSSTLSSEFRTVMEVHMQVHAARFSLFIFSHFD